jgi:hypothetical protein
VFWRNSLKFGVAAIATVGIKGKTEGDRTSVEALFAGFTAPRENVKSTGQVVH